MHSDQGSHCTITRFNDLLTRREAQQSMNRRGQCHDNAHAESFWSSLKIELPDGSSFPDLAEARP